LSFHELGGFTFTINPMIAAALALHGLPDLIGGLRHGGQRHGSGPKTLIDIP
jgi:hypothetical protein